jgi:hypothetical protein
MRTISHKDLPNADLSTVGIIPLSNIFPIEATFLRESPAYIHYDGSLFRFFELSTIEMPGIAQCIKSMDPGTSMQIYRFHTPEKESFFLSIRKEIDYSNVISSSILRKFSLNPVDSQMRSISRLTSDAHRRIGDFISPMKCNETDYLQSHLPGILCSFEIDNGVIHTNQIRSNLSYINIGDCRFGTIVSLNNMSQIPQAGKCLGSHSFLERIVLVSPSEDRQRQLHGGILENARLIDHLSAKKGTEYSVDTISYGRDDILPRGGRIFYSDVTFFLFADSITELTDRFKSFYDCMVEHDIVLYCHTNTCRRSYISMFPGNDVYGERYTLLFEYFLNILIGKALEL